MNIPLYGDQVQQLAKYPYRILKYREILKYDTLDELLGKDGAVILLYEFQLNIGHWFCVFKLDNNTIEVFDSLGYKPDFELRKVKKEYRQEFGEVSPYLSKLLRESPYKLSFNDYKLQAHNTGTCGRWVGLRLRNRHRSLNQFVKLVNKFIKDSSVRMSKDRAMVELTKNILSM